MAATALYETDILAWSEQQAGALRELAARRDLPNALDLAQVVEEIEDVGKSELNAVKSFIRLILRHAAKCLVAPNAQSLRHWHVEISNWQIDLEDRLTPSMRRSIDKDILWDRAVRQAELDLLEQTADEELRPKLHALRGTPCPVSIDDLLLDPADPAALVTRIEQAARA